MYKRQGNELGNKKQDGKICSGCEGWDAKVGGSNLLAVLESQAAKLGISTHTWMPVQGLMKSMAEERSSDIELSQQCSEGTLEFCGHKPGPLLLREKKGY